MNVFRIRLLLDFLAVALIIACLAYWWLDNLSHELFGTALLVLVIVHNVFNRRWYGTVTKRRMDATRIVNLVTIFCLAIGMTVMLMTSLLVSRDLFPFTALSGAFAVREIHMFAGYWVLLIIAIHLGTRWEVVMNAVRTTFGIKTPNAIRAWSARVVVLVVAAWGIQSFSEVAFGSKLMLTYSLDMWDFNESTLGFFLNYGSIVGLFAAVTHYGLCSLRWIRSAR
jgi:amino acid permease